MQEDSTNSSYFLYLLRNFLKYIRTIHINAYEKDIYTTIGIGTIINRL